MKIRTKYNIGDIVFFVELSNSAEKNLQSLCELSIEEIESIEITKDGRKYWVPGCDWAVEEYKLIPYDTGIFDYLDKNLLKNKRGE